MKFAKFVETLHRQARRHWAQAGPEIGLTHSEYEYLRAIKDQESRKTNTNDHGQHLQDVVVEMGVKKASASAMVVKLEERGLVDRVPCRFDARAQHVLLTKSGRALLKQGQAVYNAAAKSVLSDLSESGPMALKEVLAEIDRKR